MPTEWNELEEDFYVEEPRKTYTPEQKLMWAILSETYNQIKRRSGRAWYRHVHSAKTQDALTSWLYERSDRLLSLDSICVCLDIPADKIRRGFLTMLKGE